MWVVRAKEETDAGGKGRCCRSRGPGKKSHQGGAARRQKGWRFLQPPPKGPPRPSALLSLELRLDWVGGCLEVTPMLQGVGIWALAL